MGIIPQKLKDAWHRMGREARALEDLEDAIAAHDLPALDAIANARPAYIPREDGVLHMIGNYSQRTNHDPDFLKSMRQAVYANFDPKISKAPWREGRDENERHARRARTGFENPHYGYAFALYMNDARTMRKLNKAWIKPDDVSAKPVRASVVMAAIRRGNMAALKETLRHGASVTRGCGMDDFAPIDSFSSPSFLQSRTGLADTLMESGDTRIIAAVQKGLEKIRKRKARRFSP